MEYQCDSVGIEFLDSAPITAQSKVLIDAAPATIFRALCDADTWPRFVPVITAVTWTSPLPPQRGSTRDVTMVGGLACTEEFLSVEENREFIFRFNSFSRPGISAFAERWSITGGTDGPARIDWTMALRKTDNATDEDRRRSDHLISALMIPGLKLSLVRLARYIESQARA